MNPDKWGRHLWKSIHYIALGYPNNPDITVKNAYKTFYLDLWKYIPCYKCAKNYIQHLKELNIEPYLDSTEKLFEWTVLLHNIVNRDLGKKQLLLHDAYKIYMHDYDDNVKKSTESSDNMWMYISLLLFIIIIILIILNFRAIRT